MAGAASVQVLGANQVVSATNPVSGLIAPVDGRLRGPDFSSEVSGVSWPTTAVGYGASSGHRLVVVELPVTQLPSSVNAGVLSLALEAGGHSTALDFFSVEGGQGQSAFSSTPTSVTYVASVPSTTHDVNLVATDNGFSQSFSLWSLKRFSSAPQALYLDPTSNSASVSINQQLSVPITNPSDGVTLPSNVEVTSAFYSAFAPSSSKPAPQGSAFLTLKMSSAPPTSSYGDANWGHFFSEITPLPGTAVTLTPQGASTISATATNPVDPSTDQTTGSDSLVGATYSFLVPLSASKFTMSIGPSSTQGAEYVGFVGSDSTQLTVGGPVTTTFQVPAWPTPAVQPTPPWVGKPNPATFTASSNGGSPAAVSGGGGSGITVPIAIVVLLVVGVGVFIARKRGLLTFSSTGGRGAVVQTEATSTETVTTVAPDPETAQPIDESAPGEGGLLRISVIGPVTIEPHEGRLADPVVATIGYLAFHAERPRSFDDIQGAVWAEVPAGQEIMRSTFLNYVSKIRQGIEARHLPDAGPKGYRLVDFTTDVDELERFLDDAEIADSEEAIALRARALELLRGRPFEGEKLDYVSWVTRDGLDGRIVSLVRRLCETEALRLRDLGDAAGAEEVLRKGLRVAADDDVLREALALR